MQGARMLGNYIAHLAENKGLSTSDLGKLLGCNEHQAYMLIKGRGYASFAQISLLAKELGTTVEKLLVGDKDIYAATAVHCMNSFRDEANREMILDFIDDYVDLCEAVTAQV